VGLDEAVHVLEFGVEGYEVAWPYAELFGVLLLLDLGVEADVHIFLLAFFLARFPVHVDAGVLE